MTRPQTSGDETKVIPHQVDLVLLEERLAILKVRREVLDLKETFLMGHLADIHELMASETVSSSPDLISTRPLDLENRL